MLRYVDCQENLQYINPERDDELQESFQIKIKDNEGKLITDYFAEKGGPTAHLGVTVPGFPNFFFIGGELRVES